MDCRTAIDILEVVSSDSAEPEFAEAAAHLASCRQCNSDLQLIRAMDDNIGRAMRDVTVPIDLKDRLLQMTSSNADDLQTNRSRGLAVVSVSAESSDAVQSIQTTSQRPVSRRFAVPLVASIAVCLVVGLGVWKVLDSSPSQTELSKILADLPVGLKQLDAFDQAFVPTFPREGWRSNRLRVSSHPRGTSLGTGGKHIAALYSFTLATRRKTPVSGVLVVLPKKFIRNPPEETSIHDKDGDYVKGYTRTTWLEGDFVFVVFVRGGHDAMEILKGSLQLPPA